VQLVIEKGVARRLAEMPQRQRAAMMDRLKAIARNPFARHANVRSMRGEQDLCRLRQGGWRAVYRVDRSAQQVRVLLVDTREQAYR